jgi:hypothetical protein
MCPACVTGYLLMTVGGASSGGLAAFAVKKIFLKPDRNHQTNEEGDDENRHNGIEDTCNRNRS